MDFVDMIDELAVSVQNIFRNTLSSVAPDLVTPYDKLPDPPTPEPPETNRLEAMTPDAQAQFVPFEEMASPALAGAGYNLMRGETVRTGERQLWLWKIGREFKAPGRTGIVTDVQTPQGPHPRGIAVDYRYVAIATGKGVDPNTDSNLYAVLSSLADQFPALRWGGNFTLSSGDTDPAHWELRS